MHTKGADKQGLWREKNGGMIDATLDASQRKPQREHFNKAAQVCSMLQGSNSNADIDSLGVDNAWALCKQKVNGIWFPHFHYNILGDEGNAAVRTVYNLMIGKDTLVSKDQCTACVQQCLITPVATNAVSLAQPSVSGMRRASANMPISFPDASDDCLAGLGVQANDSSGDVPTDNESAVLNIDDYAQCNGDDSAAPNGDELVECFVCERCAPQHLYRQWSDYTHCAMRHLRVQPQDRHHFFKDEVRKVMGRKSDPARPTSRYVAMGSLYYKSYSAEEKRIFLRERIIYRHILKVNDRIDIQLEEGQPARVAVVVDAKLYLLKGSWAVKAALLDADKIGILEAGSKNESIWVSSILSIHNANASAGNSPFKGRSLTASLARPTQLGAAMNTTGPPRLDFNSPHEATMTRSKLRSINDFFPPACNPIAQLQKLQSPASESFMQQAAASAPVPILTAKQLHFESPAFKSPNIAAASAATTRFASRQRMPGHEQVPEQLATIFSGAQHTPPTPTKRNRGQESTIIDSGSPAVVDYQLGTGAHIILRDIAAFGTCFRIPHVVAAKAGVKQLSSPAFLGEPHTFPLFKYGAASFVEEDYGTRFDGIYPVPIQHALTAFDLQESYRCFFLALGIATNIDPFLLQCLFRTHARTLELNEIAILESLGGGNDDHDLEALRAVVQAELQEAVRFKTRDVSVDSRALRFFWPIEFDNIRIVVLSVHKNTTIQQVFNADDRAQNMIIDTDDASDGKKTIFLKLQSGHYTGLTLVQGSVTLNIEQSPQWFLHGMDARWRCPSIETMHFQEHVTEKEYVASAVQGALPSEDEVNTLWLRVTAEQGITFDVHGQWLTGLPQGISVADWNQQGSLAPDSWNTARNALVNEYLNADNLHSRPSRAAAKSPARCPHFELPKSTDVPLVFLDVGSESGRGLVKMLHDDRITHAAGVELQPGWFQLCVVLFRRLRTLFIDEGYRLPSITIIQSCLLLTENSGLAYLYATCSIAIINNEVFDKKPYFVAHKGENKLADDVRNAPLHHSKDQAVRSTLSANAAFTLSKYFQNTTCIAVFKPDFFNDKFGYSIGNKYKVKATWTVWTDLHITIKLHTQHMTIAEGTRFACASPKYVGLWQEYMHKWSKSLEEAYLIMRQAKYWTKSRQKGRVTKDKGKELVDIPSDASDDEEDLEIILPIIPELQVCNQGVQPVTPGLWCGFNLQCLTSLHPTKMLHQNVLNNYMFLLKSHFCQISFVPTMMYQHQSLLAIEASNVAKRSFCNKYLFNHQEPENANTFIFAMNPGMHWNAFKIDFQKEYIATMCSLNNTLDTEARQLKQCISSIVPAARNFQHISVTVPYQENHYDCGPLCCMFMLYLAQNDISSDTCLGYDTLPTAAAMRLRIFADIAAKKLTILVPTC